MSTDRCPDCFKRMDGTHRSLGRCPSPLPPPRKERPWRSQAGYVPPSRASRRPREEYLAEVRVSPEEKRRKATARMAEHRARKRAQGS